MRKLLTILFLLITSIAGATDYYVSNTGNNSNTGLSDAQAWLNITKVNSVWNAGSFAPGDHIYFKRGGAFYGTILVKESGSSGSPITIGAYGTGTDPVITGFTTIATGWIDEDNGIWDYSMTPESTPNILLIDGVNTPYGRTPNTGYYTIESGSNGQLTDLELPANPNYTGGEAVVRTWYWMLERGAISSHSSHTLYFSSLRYAAKAGYGYFIQNHYDCLNTFGEWCFNSNTLYTYFGGVNPYSHIVKISSLNYVVNITNYNYITIDGVTLEGGNYANVYLSGADNIVINDCNIRYCGRDGIYGSTTSDYLMVQNSVFDENNNTAMNLNSGTHHTLAHNFINHSGYYPGMGQSSDQDYSAIISRGDYGLITYNDILNSGYDGVAWGGQATEITYNFIDYVTSVKDDGGGLYSYRDYNTAKVVRYNIIMHSVGSDEAIGEGNDRANGIYNDGAFNIDYSYNTVAHCFGGAVFINACQNITATYNTLFDNSFQLWITSEPSTIGHAGGHAINHNICFAYSYDGDWLQSCMKLAFIGLSQHDYGTQDYNYFCRPINDDNYMDIWPNAWQWNPDPRLKYNLTEWRGYLSEDAHSTSTPVTVSSLNDIHFIYNDTTFARNWVLSAAMKDGTNTTYSGTITLQPYTSLALIGAGTVYETGGTLPVYVPTVLTSSATVNGTTVYTGGDVTANGGAPVTARGVVYDMGEDPYIEYGAAHTHDGTGSGNFTSTITGLDAPYTYHYKAYATNSAGTGYGPERSFNTTVLTPTVSGVIQHLGRWIVINGHVIRIQ
jgi:hypothetical protein